jgi:hypothetical protein
MTHHEPEQRPQRIERRPTSGNLDGVLMDAAQLDASDAHSAVVIVRDLRTYYGESHV